MKSIITIGREFGSGGREIGKKLADQLNVPFYDKELLSVASKESGICEELFVDNDERQSSSIIYSLVMGTYPIGDGGKIYPDMPLNHKIFLAQFDAIKSIAAAGPCVIVGRCADYVLKENKNLVNVFISGDMNKKVERAKTLYSIPSNKIEEFIKKTDKKRASYYNYYSDKKWGVVSNYDLCLNSSKIGIDNTVLLIKAYIDIKEGSLK